ncbi:hypothetical protein ACFOQM_12335 [Paenibacillus sp. GCM10012307]|uniref:Uncharacterized protein n=1 Tax=Paenibacillus roseus TaxID=2798579 RepID=A0A934MR77_9BACL|nr:hypothetical protein [Paenibacillus roseus]MBJ6362079.1 hypothetical protein [Paenibacillus roseus]
MNIELTDCPQVLQDRVRQLLESIPTKVIAVRRIESLPYKDKSVVVTRYKAYLQYAYEISILSMSVTTGLEDVLDGQLSQNTINGGDILTILEAADYIKDDVIRLLNK